MPPSKRINNRPSLSKKRQTEQRLENQKLERNISIWYEDNPTRLKEVSMQTGLTSQYIVNLIKREKFIQPRCDEYGYIFTKNDIDQIVEYVKLRNAGIAPRTIREQIGHRQTYARLALEFQNALKNWKEKGDPASWRALYEAIICDLPNLSDVERKLLYGQQEKEFFTYSAAKVGLTESKAKQTLQGAKSKVADAIFEILFWVKEA